MEQLITGELVLKSYMPLQLEKGMLFLTKFQQSTRFETSELWELTEVPKTPIEDFITINGAPVELMIVDEEENVLATDEQIGWWDEGEECEEFRDITLEDINMIFNENNGMLNVLSIFDEEQDRWLPCFLMDKVILSDLQFDEDEDEDDEEKWMRKVNEEEEEGPCMSCSGTGEDSTPDTRCIICDGSGSDRKLSFKFKREDDDNDWEYYEKHPVDF
jgi:hypothetical protein